MRHPALSDQFGVGMTALVVIGIVALLIGAAFFWLNNNTPVQTRIPALTLPLGAALLLISLGMQVPA